MIRKAILLAVICLFYLSYADDNDYNKPIPTDSLDKRVNYIESTFNAKIENVMEQLRIIQNKQNDYESAVRYLATQVKKDTEELKAQIEMLTEELAKLKGERPSVSVQQPKVSEESVKIQTRKRYKK